ncbi:MAG: Stk1 family PASTA domain-containing Ser/Thr kinase [Actinomycetota bacterium]|nr:Stk1 family PASTA domain-containing Ser/Thr kinase [Actinomycetota bacterium]
MTGTPLLLGDRYEIGDVLGRGGMAEVHLGRDLRLGRPVAVKVLRADLARDPSFQTRFRREAQSAASLNHPAIVSVYDTGEDVVAGRSVPYIVMEYVEGSSLRDLVSAGHRLLPERALEITAGVLAALDYSHRHGIIHRDIKPGNVMLTRAGEIKVMDFGIARAIADSAATMTQTAAVIGTAQYLSPEQARGEQVDARSDIYSTGCLLYELLTGRPPFVGDSPVAVAYQHVREEPRPPSVLEPEVPPAVDAITLEALRKEPAERYQSAADMRADIDRALAGRPVLARGASGAGAAAVGAAGLASAPPAGPMQVRERVRAPQRAGGRREEDRRRSGLGWLVLLPLLLLLGVGAFLVSRDLFSAEPQPLVRVPRVVGQQSEEAGNRIRGLGLEVRTETRESDRDPGEVLDQEPEAGTLVRGDSTVTLSVARERGSVRVPSIVGLPLAQAEEVLRGLGLRVGATESEDSPRQENEVLDTEPAPGRSVDAGSAIALQVASGRNAVPDVEGRALAAARVALEEAGFRVQNERSKTAGVAPGRVLSQTPDGGASARLGTTVTLIVAAAPDPAPNSGTPSAPASPTGPRTPTGSSPPPATPLPSVPVSVRPTVPAT